MPPRQSLNKRRRRLTSRIFGAVDDIDTFADLKDSIGVFNIDNLPNNDWRKPIVEFLQNPTGSTDRKIKYKALSYVIMGN